MRFDTRLRFWIAVLAIAMFTPGCDEDPVTMTDGIAPAAVSDLIVASPHFRTATLSWTAPGDDGSEGQATDYDVRHATSPITDSNWNDATPVDSLSAPAVAGTVETLTVTALEPSAEQWFAVRAADDVGNLASLSNIVAVNVSEPQSPDELLEKLELAYGERDYTSYQNVFSSSTDEAPFYFFLNAPVNGIDHWDVAEELRIHRRMFMPEDPLPSESPVPAALWPVAISIQLTRTASTWTERSDLYRTPANPEGLDAAKWKASEAEFHADVLWEMQGDTDYRVDGRANFIVIEDLTKAAGEARKYLIYRWEDLGSFSNALASFTQTTWGSMKRLYK